VTSRNQMQYGTDRLRPISRANRTVQITDVSGEDRDGASCSFLPSTSVPAVGPTSYRTLFHRRKAAGAWCSAVLHLHRMDRFYVCILCPHLYRVAYVQWKPRTLQTCTIIHTHSFLNNAERGSEVVDTQRCIRQVPAIRLRISLVFLNPFR
jgi:hypothetical protein